MALGQIIKESISVFIGIFAALLVWWLKQNLDQRRKRDILLIAISAEFRLIRSRIIQFLEELTRLISENQEPESYEFCFEPKIYNENIENLGQIYDQWLVGYIVQAYALIDLYNERTCHLKSENKLPLCARQLELMYDVFDGIDSYIYDKYKVRVADTLDALDAATDLMKKSDITMNFHKLIFDKYPDLAIQLFSSKKEPNKRVNTDAR